MLGKHKFLVAVLFHLLVMWMIFVENGVNWAFFGWLSPVSIAAGAAIVLIILRVARRMRSERGRRRFFAACLVVGYLPILISWAVGLIMGGYSILMALFVMTLWLPVSISVTFAHWLYEKRADKGRL